MLWLEQYTKLWSEPGFRLSIAFPAVLFVLSLVANFYAALYATERASNSVADIILSNIPVFDVEPLFVSGTLLLIAFSVWMCLSKPWRIPFMLYALAFFFLIRSVFISLTHVGPFPTRIALDASELVSRLFGGADLFFSGHVGVAFLFALIFWHERYLRHLFLASSIFFGIIALLGHLHYSIDVFAAFFITYGIYDMAKYLFPKEYQLLLSGNQKTT